MDEKKNKFVIELIEKICDYLGVKVEVEVEDTITKGVIFNLTSEDANVLIGRDGSVLKSIERIAREATATAFKHEPFYHFSIDVDDYIRKREWYLKETVKSVAKKVLNTGQPYRFPPMPNYERKIIHSLIQNDYPDLKSESIGEDPHRKLIISKA